MTLVQIFSQSPSPDLLARHLLDQVLERFRESALHYEIYLLMKQCEALSQGTTAEAEIFERAIGRHSIHQRIPERLRVDELFTERAHATYGDGLFPWWAAVLIQLCKLDEAWEEVVLGVKPKPPVLLPCFRARAHDVRALLPGERAECRSS